MALQREATGASIAFRLVGSEFGEFEVSRYRGREGLCQLYRFEIELVCDEEEVSLDDVVGKRASLRIASASNGRWFNGIISRFESITVLDGRTFLKAELVPYLWRLTHRYDSRIFQEKTAIEIIQAVLSEAGITSADVDIKDVKEKHPIREYCVQYRETDYNFICRLMEEEGIRWYFEHGEDAHVLVLSDSETYLAAEGLTKKLPYETKSGLNATDERIYHFRLGQSVRPGAVVLDDFNFENPALPLEAKYDLKRDLNLSFRDVPGVYGAQADGNDIAKIRAQEFETCRVLGAGQSNSTLLSPGRTFEMGGHPNTNLSRKYLVTAVEHEGQQPLGYSRPRSEREGGVIDERVLAAVKKAQDHGDPAVRELAEGLLQIVSKLSGGDASARRTLTTWVYHAGQVSRDLAATSAAAAGNPFDAISIPNLLDDLFDGSAVQLEASTYDCKFDCMPDDVAYRPPRITPWPVVRGSQTARIVGPSGEEIHTDEYGRVKVKFNWDRVGVFDDKASCWIRVVQGMAGGQYGMMFLPRVGQEVVVDFLEGNPDKPIIIGRVYNADHMPPYPLPDEKTKSVIKTHSSKGGGGTNEIRFEDLAGKEQLMIHAQKDLHMRIGNQERRDVKEDQYLKVEGEQREDIGNHRSIMVGAKDALEVKDVQAVVVGGDVFHDFKSNHDHKVASEYHLKADKVVVEASAISLKSGGNFVLIDSGGVTIVGSQIKLNSGGSALSSSVSGSAASPAEPEPSDEVVAGQDVSYTGETFTPTPPEEEPAEGNWISIELKDDDDGNPVAGEYYEITTPSGKVLSGNLNVNGRAKRFVKEEGDCKITFPRRDEKEWNPG